MFYRQCLLKKKNSYLTSWLPEKFAKCGKYIKLIDDDGWKVMAVWSRLSEKEVMENSRDYLSQRAASDI
jgi:hypothetical protein